MAGRPRKPTAILELNGAFKHDPKRARPNEPKDDRGIGDPPERLPAEMLPYWDELVVSCAHGVLKISDRWTVEIAARLMHKFVTTPQFVTGAELSNLRTLLSSLGMTPADRTKLSVPIEKKANKFADIASEASANSTHRPN